MPFPAAPGTDPFSRGTPAGRPRGGGAMELKDYLRIIRRRWQAVVAVVAVMMLSYLLILGAQTRRYEATSKVMIQVQNLQYIIANDVTGMPDFFSYKTRLALITSEPVCREAARIVLQEHGRVPSKGEVETVAAQIRGSIRIEEESDTQIVSIVCGSDHAEEAINQANALSRAFIAYAQSQERTEIEEAKRFIQEQIEHTRKVLEASERGLRSFSQNQGVADLNEEMKLLQRNIADQELKLRDMEFTRRILANRVRGIRGDLGEVGTAPVSSAPGDVAGRLKAELAGLHAELAKLRLTHTEKHPEVAALKVKMQSLSSVLVEEMQKESQLQLVGVKLARYREMLDLEAEDALMADRVEGQAKSLERLHQKVVSLSSAELDFARLARQVEVEKSTLMSFVKKLEELSISERLKGGKVRHLSDATMARPRPKQSEGALPFVALVSVLVGIGSAYLLEYVNTTIRTEHDVKRYLNLNIVGMIPFIKEEENRIIANVSPKSPLSEIFNTTTTLMQSLSMEYAARVFMVSSAKAAEGKSTVSANLAIALCRSGSRVILVDADLRRSVQHRIFRLDNSLGLSTLLAGRIEVQDELAGIRDSGNVIRPSVIDRVLQPTDVEGLQVIPGGPIPSNPVNLLKSKRFTEVLEALKSRADIIIFDVPPVNSAVDTMAIAPKVDAVVLLVSAGETTREEATYAKRLIENAGGNIIGTIINNVTIESRGYYYYYEGYRYYRERE
ncbi:MAG: AAA family ATPase [Planctomycetota bacterium]